MKKAMKLLSILLLTMVVLCGCGGKREFVPDYEHAVGVILINQSQELPEAEKVYATFCDHEYLFNLDAASVYYFNANEEEAYAGEENFARLAFGVQIDDESVGAQGTVCYRLEEDSDNALNARYIYRDEQGIYFNSGDVFAQVRIEDQTVLNTSEFPCSIDVQASEPTAHFTLTSFDAEGRTLMTKDYTEEEIEDYARLDVERDVDRIEVTKYADDDRVIGRNTITRENYSTYICFSRGGQVLDSKVINFIWQEN